jgi:hypothetical protein
LGREEGVAPFLTKKKCEKNIAMEGATRPSGAKQASLETSELKMINLIVD